MPVERRLTSYMALSAAARRSWTLPPDATATPALADTCTGRGVAMGQSVEDVRAAADHVTGTVYEDGAAQELSKWFP